MSFVTPVAALVALAAFLPLGAWAAGRRRADAVGRSLALPPPQKRTAVRAAAGAGAVVALALAAAQPVLTHTARERERTDAQALFVLDTSRSMAASSTSQSPTRLDRAVAAAVRLRAAIPEVPSGIATLTDRVLPDLLPVAGKSSFDLVAQRGVAIESPPPAGSDVRATSYDALAQVASGNYFAPKATRRLIVLLTDGESNPVNTGELAHALGKGYRVVAVRLWAGSESVYGRNRKPEPAYRADPLGKSVLSGVAGALGGRAFEESQLGAAESYLRSAAGHGPTTATATSTPTRTALAPYLAGLALVLLAVALGLRWPNGPTVQSALS
jgi:hypothetical protein